MRVEGGAAKKYRAVRLDSCQDVNKGELVLADDVTGEVVFKDTPDTTKALTLGPASIRILTR